MTTYFCHSNCLIECIKNSFSNFNTNIANVHFIFRSMNIYTKNHTIA